MTRTPLRISIGGGGTDLPSYYREFGGFVISAAIDKYAYISIHESFTPGYILKFSETQTVSTIAEIRHPLIREAFQMHSVPSPLELVSITDVPAGTGLGSSGSFLVGMLHAIHANMHHPVTAEMLAREAIDIEMNRLQEPVGKQDQYIAAYGGLLCQTYHEDDTVSLAPLQMTRAAVHELHESLMLFFVGYTRASATLLEDQRSKSRQHDRDMLDSLHFTKQLGRQIQQVLEASDIASFGQLMHEHWLRKRTRSPGMSSGRIDELYDLARSQGGATGGKLVGAGGSGFLLFQTNDRRRLRAVMTAAGLLELNFGFDFDGSVIMLRNR
jgi:D-glycero-alpha-D-manno-heptose-7-phosphate kinase